MSQFDFAAYNKLTDGIAPGLKIALAEGLIRSSVYQMERFNNPLTDELYGVGMELKSFRVKYKAAAEARKNTFASENTAKNIDNSAIGGTKTVEEEISNNNKEAQEELESHKSATK